jgi:hypothetical protein
VSRASKLAEQFRKRKGPVRKLSTANVPDLVLPPEDGPRILFYDIETAPALAWVWDAYDTNIIDVEKEWYLLCVAFRWLGEEETHFISIFQSPTFRPDKVDDMYVARRLAVLFDQADVVIAHNGDRFDKRKANARFLANGLDPPSPYESVDTKKLAKREFAHLKNNLDYLSHLHGMGNKLPTQGFHLWRGCMTGDPEAWRIMEEYNRRDVELLEEIYYKLAPWVAPGSSLLPNVGHWGPKGQPICPICGSDEMNPRGMKRTKVSEFQAWQCQNCRGYARSRERKSQWGNQGVKIR